MEELMERIKDVVASQGTSWLVKMAEELARPPAAEAGESSNQLVLPSSEEPRGRHARSNPVVPSSDEPRGRPVRRRNPPARLSPSPVVKRAVPVRSPRTEGARRSGTARSQCGMEEAEPIGRIRVSDGEVEGRDGPTFGVSARPGSGSGEGERLSRSGDGVSAYGAAKIRTPSGRGVTSGERHTAHRPYSRSSLPAPSFPLAMPEDNEADVNIQGAAPDGGGRGGMLPCFLVGNDRRELLALVKMSVSSTTWRRYNNVWKEWIAAAGGRFPSEERAKAVTLDTLAAMRKKGASADAAKKHLTAVAFLIRLHGSRDVTKDFVFGQIIKGWKKDKVIKDGRRPITFELLNAILEVLGEVCEEGSEAELFRVAFAIAFFAAMRIGELVSASKSRPGGLMYGDVLVDEDCIKIGVRRSKTDVYGVGEWLRIGKLGTKWCPVVLITGFLERHCGTGPFLKHASGLPLTKYQFTAVMRGSLNKLGLNPKDFGSHSFRIGAVTSAFSCGMGIEGIKRVGRWRSDAYRSYVRPDLRVFV
ncbi:uncharacterized protein [Eleutherodactylus coqui]|uniref:uncharacterized protein n=1 Tax=Eleutherodactylus coqui TaxID=57060 RepID=UPI003462B9B2